MKKQRLPFGLYNALLCLLAGAIMVLVCLCVQSAEKRWYLKWDVSDDQLSVLSDYTQEQLSALTQDITLYQLLSPGTQNDVADLQTETLQKMAATCARVHVKTVDPVTQPQVLLSLAGESSGIPDGTVFARNEKGTRTIRIDADDCLFSQRIGEEIYTIYCGEAMLIGAISQVCTDDPAAVWFVTGHGEATDTDCARLTLQLQALGFDVHNGTLAVIRPEAGDVVMLLDPRSDLTETEVDALKGFVSSGVHLTIACGADTPLAAMPQFNTLCSLYGLRYTPGWAVEHTDESAFYVDRPELLSPVLADSNVMAELPGRLILPRACAIAAPEIRPGVTASRLLVTSSRTTLKADASADAYAVSSGDVSGQMTLAMMAENGDSHILLLASADMLRDESSLTGASVIDASENLAFITACLEHMTDRSLSPTLDAGVKQLPAQLISFDSAHHQQIVSILMLTLLPGLLLIIMAAVLIRRRRM